MNLDFRIENYRIKKFPCQLIYNFDNEADVKTNVLVLEKRQNNILIFSDTYFRTEMSFKG